MSIWTALGQNTLRYVQLSRLRLLAQGANVPGIGVQFQWSVAGFRPKKESRQTERGPNQPMGLANGERKLNFLFTNRFFVFFQISSKKCFFRFQPFHGMTARTVLWVTSFARCFPLYVWVPLGKCSSVAQLEYTAQLIEFCGLWRLIHVDDQKENRRIRYKYFPRIN